MQFQSLCDIKINGQLVFSKVFEISHVSALLGPNPYTGKVESEQETVVIKKKILSSSFFSFGDLHNCNVTCADRPTRLRNKWFGFLAFVIFLLLRSYVFK